MLKHRYNSLSESISDFDRMLDGMNGVQPLERHSVDEDVLAMFREEQELVRLERQIEHLYSAVYGSGMPISEAESAGIRAIHAHAAATYESAAEKLMAHVRARTAELEKVADASREKFKAKLAGMQKVHDTFRRKAEEHRSLASPASSERKIVNDSVNESIGRKAAGGISVYRRLAGIEETVQMPRDPGVLGTTRLNAEYEQMAQPFDEACDDAHEKAEKKDIKKIKASADRLDREHEEGLASNIADKTRNAIRWTQGANPVERRLAKAQDAVARVEKTAKKLDKIKVSNESRTIEDRIREIREGRPKAMQIKGQEAMMQRSFPKRHAQWTQDKEKIVASGRKVKDDERATPRWLNQRAGKVKDDPENDKP